MAEQYFEDVDTTPEETQKRALTSRVLKRGAEAVEAQAKKLERLSVDYVPVGRLKANPYNPNRQSDHDFQLLLSSMEEDGFTTPILVNKEDNVIVDGEHRWRAAQVLGMIEIPVVYVDMGAAQMRLSTVRHNVARGSHDVLLEGALLRDLEQLGALDWAQQALGMDDVEMQVMLHDMAAPEVFADLDFSEAWLPQAQRDALVEAAAMLEEGEVSELPRESMVGGIPVYTGISAEVLAQHREQEKLLVRVKRGEEAALGAFPAGVFRLQLMFSGGEGVLVKGVLGDRPAAKLLEMCRREEAG